MLTVLGTLAADSRTVAYKSGDETMQGVLYTPGGNGPFPAIIVIHEWWGLSDWVKEQAAKLAGQGYVALAIDLDRGQVAENSEVAHELSRGLPEDHARRDLRAAFEFLAAPAQREQRAHRRDGVVHGRRLIARCGVGGASAGRRRHPLRPSGHRSGRAF